MAILLKNKAPYILSCALLSSAMLLSTGCSNEGADDAAEQSGAVSGLLEETTSAATAVIDDTKTVVEDTTAAASSVVDSAKTAVTDTATSVASDVKTTEATAAVTETIAEKKADVPAVDGAKIYANCSGCHGENGGGGVGPALNTQASSDIADKLQRYKAGEQIGPMSGMMQPIAKNLSDAEIDAVSAYSSSLK
ncbi:MAG: c-type cytochrome [Thiomicrorhabdus sp.]|nr:c-type cytochrome [Thiomicrorhabdus sp.]